jgi:hypothetical protein
MDRLAFLNLLIERRGYTSYLEVGVWKGDFIRQINAVRKTGVDPRNVEDTSGFEFVRARSDQFFEELDPSVKFDLVFIDGLHQHEQVLRDVDNSLAHLSEGGTVTIHDCNPGTKIAQRRVRKGGPAIWNGDVWKAMVLLRCRGGLFAETLGIPHGIGVIRPDPTRHSIANYEVEHLNWGNLDYLRDHYLGLRTVEEVEHLL